MNKFKFYFILSITTFSLFSCSKDDNSIPIVPPRDYGEQYVTDNADIVEYLNNYTFDVTNKPGYLEDQDVVMTKITDPATQRSIMSYLNAATYPKLLIRNVNLHDVDYEVYYLVLRPGVGESPTNVDGILAAYSGDYLSRDAATKVLSTTFFDENIYPQSFFELYDEVVVGWSEIFPQFKMGTSVVNENGKVTQNDFWAGVMFLPSGLGYYNTGKGTIPAYAPLIFSFKLYNLERKDQDNDGIPSYQEDLDGDGYMYFYSSKVSYPTLPEDAIRYADDTDQDGVSDFYDTDDDGDKYSTKYETKRPDIIVNGVTTTNGYYPFEGALIDDPLTPYIDERQGVPSYDASTKTLDYTTPGRNRVYLDASYPLVK